MQGMFLVPFVVLLFPFISKNGRNRNQGRKRQIISMLSRFSSVKQFIPHIKYIQNIRYFSKPIRNFDNEDYSKLTPEDINNLNGIYKSLNDILDIKPTHHYTDHDPIRKGKIEDDPSIAYIFEEQKEEVIYPVKTRLLSVGICGAPNVGKSTLMNTLIGEKVSAVSNKPNTTRCNRLGIKTVDSTQLVFYDTPGILEMKKATKQEQAYTECAEMTIQKLDAIIAMFDASEPLTTLHRHILNKVCEVSYHQGSQLYIALNKVDLVKPKTKLIHYANAISDVIWKNKVQMVNSTVNATIAQQQWENEYLFMISALNHDGTDNMIEKLCSMAKPCDWMFPKTAVTDMSREERECEIVREKVFKYYSKPIPEGMHLNNPHWEDGPNGDTFHVVLQVYDPAAMKDLANVQKKIKETAELELSKMENKKVNVSFTLLSH